MQTRPRIKPDLSRLDKTIELAGKIILFMMWGLVLYIFSKMPGTIPIHFDASGQPDRYGNKITFLLLPLIASTIYVGMTQLSRYPHIFNYMSKITTTNARTQYTTATRILRFWKLAILFVFSLIILLTYLTTIGVINGLGVWFLPSIVALFIIPTVFSISQAFRKVPDEG